LALAKAKDNMMRYYNQHQIPTPKYHTRDQVFLVDSDIKTTQPSLKSAHQYLSPYVVQKTVSQNTYQL